MLGPGQTQPMSFRPELKHIENGFFGKEVLIIVRRWLAHLDIELTGKIATAAQLGSYEHYRDTGGRYENTEFARELIKSNAFAENGTLPKLVIEEYIKTIAGLCPKVGNTDTYVLSIAEGIKGYGTLTARINDGILVAAAKRRLPELRSTIDTAIVANDEKELLKSLWNEDQEKSVRKRVIERATNLKLPDGEVFLPLYEKIMNATLRKQVEYLLAQREDL